MEFFVLLFLSLSTAFAAQEPPLAEGYKLLRLPEQHSPLVKWKSTQLGQPAVITYSFARESLAFPMDFGSCLALEPLAGLVQSTALPEKKFLQEIQAGMALWEEAAGVRFVFTSDAQAADLVIGMSKDDDRSLHARVALKLGDAGKGNVTPLAKAVLCLDKNENWSLDPAHTVTSHSEKILSVKMLVAHEFGHMIGLNHPDDKNQVMHYKIRGGQSELAEGDKQGAQLLYGTRRSIRP